MAPKNLDLDPESRRALQFDDLLDEVAAHAGSAAGAAAVRASVPLADRDRLAEATGTVAEALRWVAGAGRLLPAGLPDPGGALERLAIPGARLEPVPLRELATVLNAAADVRRSLAAANEEDFPRLVRSGRRLPDLRAEARLVLGSVDPEGRIADEASPELAEVRRTQRRVAERLRATLMRILREPGAEAVIRDDFITQRNGRYVVPVRTDAPRPLHGIFHAASSSGATRFVEPLETVELNNELVALAEREAEEIERILLRFSEALRGRRGDVEAAVVAIADLDAVQARVLFARERGGVLAEPGDDGCVRLEGVRHALLDRRLHEQGKESVPLDLILDPETHVLVLSGPNTGGKTVALKTVGLAALMAQAAIPIPARRCMLPVFRQVRADVGDHQSIEANLSTFSAHVAALKRFLDDAAAPALFLFDEIGTGTDPGEGAALAQAVLERLLGPGMTVVATTHQEALKAWALTTAGALTAAMEFDAASMRPTYRVRVGAAGESAGLAIAERLGLDPDVVNAARRKMGPSSDLTRRYAERLEELLIAAERDREALARERTAIEARRVAIEVEAERDASNRARESQAVLAQALKEFRASIREELRAIHDVRERAAFVRRADKGERRVIAEEARQRSRIAPAVSGVPTDWAPPRNVERGQDVLIASLGRIGKVEAVQGNRIEVRLGSVAFTADLGDLRVGPGGATVATPSAAPASREQPRRAMGGDPPDAPAELKLIGLTVEEGLETLDRYLDRAALSGLVEVRVIHGHGTGRLRQAVRRHLRGHVQVAELRPGKPEEGGDGATVVRMAD